VRRGPFRYNRSLEERRIEKARALIERVAPGPFEDPNYLAFLSYQAASIELAYELMPISEGQRERFSRFLLGTAHDPEINAFASRLKAGGYTVVVLNSGLVDFIYQAAKATVEVLDPTRATEGRSAVSATYDLAGIRAKLTADPGPADRLYRTLEAYFFKGYPRAAAFEPIVEEHYPFLSVIVGMAERWVIGHEYGHGLAPSFAQAPAGVSAERAEEYFADDNATIATVFSGGSLDAVPPEFPLGGAIFALACLGILEAALDTVSHGGTSRRDAKSQSHPAPRDRAARAVNCFRQFFDVAYRPGGRFDLFFVPKPEVPETHNFSKEQVERAYAYANILRAVWQPARERLLHDFRQERPLHAVWR
jgi:hypothetical protein